MPQRQYSMSNYNNPSPPSPNLADNDTYTEYGWEIRGEPLDKKPSQPPLQRAQWPHTGESYIIHQQRPLYRSSDLVSKLSADKKQ